MVDGGRSEVTSSPPPRLTSEDKERQTSALCGGRAAGERVGEPGRRVGGGGEGAAPAHAGPAQGRAGATRIENPEGMAPPRDRRASPTRGAGYGGVGRADGAPGARCRRTGPEAERIRGKEDPA